VCGARFPDVGGLRKRPDRRGREGGQVETRVLHADAIRECAGAPAHRTVDAGDTGCDLRIVNPGRSFAGGGGLIRHRQTGLGGSTATGECRREGRQLFDFLY